ncbi:hypothetical protein Gasu2_17190 [Galdieria sulphuraria]|uniref:Uncharacterized protein n=1 Tax=Galdieria sulphuraria TaxID=130081 RepID=M2VS45_GALSU|nr:uncharacterized protein Gasu_64150 [Galdieria sulphuraria]EME25926.1 hypothetical protein Gasu_64150 [Galdieria sulphuraria]GJD07353.1 hypothetical protein Gasu2_17190 [Galdieria sulphuraria]|eukprot:XP_005702446.1 hypothetical protein Gasu_64150 [Galdieria sulphuraria]
MSSLSQYEKDKENIHPNINYRVETTDLRYFTATTPPVFTTNRASRAPLQTISYNTIRNNVNRTLVRNVR